MLPEVAAFRSCQAGARGGRWDMVPPVLGPPVGVPSGTARGQREVGGACSAASAAEAPGSEQEEVGFSQAERPGFQNPTGGDGNDLGGWFRGSVDLAAAGFRSRPTAEALPLGSTLDSGRWLRTCDSRSS